jgi:hypothetical protein
MQDTTDDVEEKAKAFELLLRGLIVLALMVVVGLGAIVAAIIT